VGGADTRHPVVALLATGLLWLVFQVSGVAGVNVQFAAYVAVTVPLVVVLLGPAFGRGAVAPLGAPRGRRRWARCGPGSGRG
jgi:uncharacterized integral membrane protein